MQETVSNFILSSLATWRIVHMFMYERGPWQIFWKIRQRFSDSEIDKILSCAACSSVYVAVFSCVPGTLIIKWVFSISAIVMFIEEIYGLLREESEEEDP
jgi:hypothetical protein